MMNWKTYVYEHPHVGPWYRKANAYPGWVVKGALTAAVLVVVVPLVLLSVAAILVGLFVFGVLGIAARIMSLFGGGPGRADRRPRAPGSADDGRVNVRVIHR